MHSVGGDGQGGGGEWLGGLARAAMLELQHSLLSSRLLGSSASRLAAAAARSLSHDPCCHNPAAPSPPPHPKPQVKKSDNTKQNMSTLKLWK